MAVPSKQFTVTFACSREQKDRIRQEAACLGWTTSNVVLRYLGLAPWPEGVPAPAWPPISLTDGSEVSPTSTTPQRAA